jgi:hypothetical protein
MGRFIDPEVLYMRLRACAELENIVATLFIFVSCGIDQDRTENCLNIQN